MPDKSGELHETTCGGERIVIRRVEPEDGALYPDFLADVSAEDLRLRFFALRIRLRLRTFTCSRNSFVIRCTLPCHTRKPRRFSTAVIRRYPNRGCSAAIFTTSCRSPSSTTGLHR